MATRTMRGAIRERVATGDPAFVSLGAGLKVHKVRSDLRTFCGLETHNVDALWHRFDLRHPALCAHCRIEISKVNGGAKYPTRRNLDMIELGPRVFRHLEGLAW